MSDAKTEVKPLTRSEKEAKIKDKAGFVIVFLAALLAINTMIGGSNSSKIQNNTIQANNMWAWYQAKNVRGVLYEISAAEANKPENIASTSCNRTLTSLSIVHCRNHPFLNLLNHLTAMCYAIKF